MLNINISNILMTSMSETKHMCVFINNTNLVMNTQNKIRQKSIDLYIGTRPVLGH